MLNIDALSEIPKLECFLLSDQIERIGAKSEDGFQGRTVCVAWRTSAGWEHCRVNLSKDHFGGVGIVTSSQ
jgi:hypothetical protein